MARQAKPTMKDLPAWLGRQNQRLDDAEALVRVLYRVQVDSLARAERLRKLALVVVGSQWEHRCSDKVGGCTAVSKAKLDRLATLLADLLPFHAPKGPVPAGLRKLARKQPRKA